MEKDSNEFTELEDEVDFFPEDQIGKKPHNLSKQENPEGLNRGQWIDLPEYQEKELPQQREVKIEQQVELKKFQKSKIAISKLADRKLKQEVQMIPCPFCAVQLTLEQLDHVSECEQGKSCYYCKEKYPSTLYVAHLLVCDMKEKYFAKYKLKRPKKQPAIQIRKDKIEVVKPEKRIFEVKKEPLKREAAAPKRIYNISKNIKQVPRNSQNHAPEIQRDYDRQSKIRQKQLQGFKDYQIDRIPLEEYFPIRQQDTSCIICTNEVSQGDLVMRLNCLHFFHIDCLRPWLSERSRCPTCKASIRP